MLILRVTLYKNVLFSLNSREQFEFAFMGKLEQTWVGPEIEDLSVRLGVAKKNQVPAAYLLYSNTVLP